MSRTRPSCNFKIWLD